MSFVERVFLHAVGLLTSTQYGYGQNLPTLRRNGFPNFCTFASHQWTTGLTVNMIKYGEHVLDHLENLINWPIPYLHLKFKKPAITY